MAGVIRNMANIGALEASGGGGGGGDSLLIVRVLRKEIDGNIVFEPDHTRGEVLAALQSGPVFCDYSGFLGAFNMDEGYPEIYASTLFSAPASSANTLTLAYMYFQYDENGDFTGDETAVNI